jgi:small subunit ribosomal protein S9
MKTMPKKLSRLKYYEAIGRRKSAVARVRLYIIAKQKEVNISGLIVKKGEIFVNKKIISEYFPDEAAKNQYIKPLKLSDNLDRFAISVQVKGGGKNGQLNAVILGISRALEIVDKSYRSILKKKGLLTRDARIRERRKIGTGGRARRKKQSPKR